jgi:hypothetical protein
MTRHISRTWWAACLSACLAVAACGGGGGDRAGDDEGSGDRTTTTEAAADASTTTTAPGTPSPDGAAPAPGEPGAVGTQLDVDRTFTGEGSEAFCAEVRALQQSVSGSDPERIDEATVTGQMAALTPPAEIAADWAVMVAVQQSLANSQAEDPLAGIDQAQLDAYGQSSAVIAAYLGDVCQLALMG